LDTVSQSAMSTPSYQTGKFSQPALFDPRLVRQNETPKFKLAKMGDKQGSSLSKVSKFHEGSGGGQAPFDYQPTAVIEDNIGHVEIP